jgi:SAM-dependent methyltransferase
MFRTLVETADPRPGEAILDVGCGSGALDRLLVEWTGGANPITAVDHNRAFLNEAAALARSVGLGDAINFREGNAEALPFPDASFDVVLSCTVAEEGDADRMIAEFVRVTKPGGRVGVIVRAMDFGVWLGMPLRPEVRAKLEAPGLIGSVAERGCADASLYRRCREAGLDLLLATPQFSGFVPGSRELENGLRFAQTHFLPRLSAAEAEEWHAAVAAGMRDGTMSAAMVHHCAVGRKP